MQPDTLQFQAQQPINQPVKKASSKKIMVYIIIAIISAAISGGAVWYFMNQQNTDKTKTLNSQILTKNNSISKLQKTITSLTQAAEDKTTSTTVATDDITTLKAFCSGDNSQYTVSNVYYASVTNGVYGGCNVGYKTGGSGFYRVTKMVNDKWTLVFDGQGSNTAFLKANSIPVNVVISPDAYNLLP